MGRKNGFTALRLFAAVLVILTHSYVLGANVADPIMEATRLLPASTVGVDLFFVISGYLISGSLQRSSGPISYVRNRALRILPALAVLCVVTVFIIGPMATTSPNYFSQLETYRYFENAFVFGWHPYLPGVFENNATSVVNGSLWTLQMEVICYSILLVMAWCGCFNWRGALVLTLVSCFLFTFQTFPRALLLVNYDGGIELYYLVRFTALFGGGALIKLVGRPWVTSPIVTVIAGLCILVAFYMGRTDWRYFPPIYLLALPWFIIGLAALLSAFSALDRIDISYGLYLYSYPIQQLLVQANGGAMDPMLLFVASSVITVVLAILSWFLIEHPAMSLKAGRTPVSMRSTALAEPGLSS